MGGLKEKVWLKCYVVKVMTRWFHASLVWNLQIALCVKFGTHMYLWNIRWGRCYLEWNINGFFQVIVCLEARTGYLYVGTRQSFIELLDLGCGMSYIIKGWEWEFVLLLKHTQIHTYSSLVSNYHFQPLWLQHILTLPSCVHTLLVSCLLIVVMDKDTEGV